MATIQAGKGLTGTSKDLRATLASMQSAHRLLVAEAAALRNFLPEVHRNTRYGQLQCDSEQLFH